MKGIVIFGKSRERGIPVAEQLPKFWEESRSSDLFHPSVARRFFAPFASRMLADRVAKKRARFGCSFEQALLWGNAMLQLDYTRIAPNAPYLRMKDLRPGDVLL